MLKQITNTDKNYVSVPVTDLKLDASPKVNSFNGITSDAVARAIAGASGEVPQVTENDNGKVLTAIYDEGGPAVEWAEAQGGGGDILTVIYDINDLPEGQEIDDLATEISEAVAAGKSVQLLDVNENIVANLTAIDSDFSWSGPTFMSPVDRDENLVNYFKEYHLGTDQYNRGWSVNTNYAGPQIPAPTEDDANKVAVATVKSTEWGSSYVAYEPKDATSLIQVGPGLVNTEVEQKALVSGYGTATASTYWKYFSGLQINGSGSDSLANFSGSDQVVLKVSSIGNTSDQYYEQVGDRNSIIDTSGKSQVCVWVGTWNDKEERMDYSLLGALRDEHGDSVMFEFVETASEAGGNTNYFKIGADGSLSGTVDAILGPDWETSVQYNDYVVFHLGTYSAPLTQAKWLTTDASSDTLALEAYLSKAVGNRIDATGSVYMVEYGGSGMLPGDVFDDACAAMQAGQTLVLKNGGKYGVLMGYSQSYGLTFTITNINLSGNDATSGTVTAYRLYRDGENSRWKIFNSLHLLPMSTSADQGKVLTVDSSGLPSWVTPT